MKAQKLLDELMRLDSVVEFKLYHISDDRFEKSNSIVQDAFNFSLKEKYENNFRSNTPDYVFM